MPRGSVLFTEDLGPDDDDDANGKGEKDASKPRPASLNVTFASSSTSSSLSRTSSLAAAADGVLKLPATPQTQPLNKLAKKRTKSTLKIISKGAVLLRSPVWTVHCRY
jgi:hypothetical protein